MSLKGWFLVGAFILLLCADGFATFISLFAHAAAGDRRGAEEWLIASLAAWVPVVVGLLWLKGPALLRLLLASGPLLTLAILLALGNE